MCNWARALGQSHKGKTLSRGREGVQAHQVSTVQRSMLACRDDGCSYLNAKLEVLRGQNTSTKGLLLLRLMYTLVVPACSPGAVLVQTLNRHSQQTQVQLCHCSMCPKAKLIGKVLVP